MWMEDGRLSYNIETEENNTTTCYSFSEFIVIYIVSFCRWKMEISNNNETVRTFGK